MASIASSVDNWSDSEIRTKLAELGTPVGPVTETTRKILIKKLKRLIQLQTTNANSPSKQRGSLARYSSGDDTQEETNMPPPTVKMRNRRKTTGSTELKTAVADSSISVGASGRNDSERIFRVRKSSASASALRNKNYDTDSDSDVTEGSQLRKSKRFTITVPNHSLLSRQSPKTEPTKPTWRERTPELVLLSHESKLTPNLSKRSPNVFEEAEDEELVEEEEEEEEETEEDGSRPAFQSDLLKRLTTGGRFSSSYASFDSPKRETFGTSVYSNLHSSHKPTDNYKSFSSRHEALNSYLSGDKDKYSYTSTRNPTASSSNIYKTKSLVNSVLASLYNNNLKLICGCAALFILLLAVYFFSNFDTRIHLAALDSDENKYPICGQDGVDPSICVEQKNLNAALEVSKVLTPWILERTSKAYCDSSAGDIVDKPIITEAAAIKYLSSKMPHRTLLEKDLRNLKILILSNPHWEIEVVSNGLDSTNAILYNGSFAARSVDLPMGCYLRLTAYNTFKFVLYVGLICGAVFAVVFGFRMYKLWQEQHKKEVYSMVNNILNLLCSRHDQNILPGYVAINNCRDELIQPIERDSKRKVWQDAVDFIEKHESRVRVEMHSLRGESIKVWRWLPEGGPPMSPGASPDGASSSSYGRLL